MADRHHYVAQFHLRGFLDPDAAGLPDRWLWLARCADGEVRRRAPSNVGWERGLYDVPGALSAPDARIERYLAERVEAPAASALREFSGKRPGSRGAIPPALMRYVAWAAARTPAMRMLYQEWIDDLPDTDGPFAEPPPEWLANTTERHRLHRMEHGTHGIRDDVPPDEVARLRADGWRFVVDPQDFGELMYVQAGYFYDRFFPRLRWLILDAPAGEYFVVGDRPVVWVAGGALDLPPSVLRAADAQLVAPLTCSLALAAYHPAGRPPGRVEVGGVNRAIVRAAHDWIAGPTRETVIRALGHRRPGSIPRAI